MSDVQCVSQVTFIQCTSNLQLAGGVAQCQGFPAQSPKQNTCLCQQYYLLASCYVNWCPSDPQAGGLVAQRDGYCKLVPGFDPSTGFAPMTTTMTQVVGPTLAVLSTTMTGGNNLGPTLPAIGQASVSPTGLPKNAGSVNSPWMAIASIIAWCMFAHL